jgi:predicted NACHT family NTPase
MWEWAALGVSVIKHLDAESAKPVRDAVAQQAAEQAKFMWRRFAWSRAEEAYRQRLLPLVSTTRLLGNAKPVDIDQLYTDLFVYGQPSAMRRSAQLADPEHDRREERPGAPKRQSAKEVVQSGVNLYLLGHPGAGKTTFLRYMAILACKGLLPQVPLYVQLRDVARTHRPPAPGSSREDAQLAMRGLLEAALADEFAACDFPDTYRFLHELLASGRALVLVDGLDEVPTKDGLRVAIIDSIRSMQRRYPKAQICLTCRIAASEYAFEHFEYAEIAPFTSEQQDVFLHKWFVGVPGKRERVLADWHADRSRSLRDLGRTPLLLALICLAFDDLGELPERQVDLYREALDALFKRWDSSRAIFRDPFYRSLSPHRREQLAQELAASFFERDVITYSAGDALPVVTSWFRRLPEWNETEQEIDAEEVLVQLEAQHGVVIQRSRGTFSFAHLSIQEFLTARSVCEGHPQRTLELVASRGVHDVRWREVAVFCAGLLQDGTGFLEMAVRSVHKHLNQSPELLALLTHVNSLFLGGQTTPSVDNFVEGPQSTSHPLRQTADILRRVQRLPWGEEASGFKTRAALLREHLLQVHAGRSELFKALANEGSVLSKYLYGVSVIVDCAAVATCAARARVLGPLLANIRS